MSDLNDARHNNITNALIKGVPIAAIIVGKLKSLEEQIVQLLWRIGVANINLQTVITTAIHFTQPHAERRDWN